MKERWIVDEFEKKGLVFAVAIVCLTIAIISSFSVGNVVYPVKSILKNNEIKNNIAKNDEKCSISTNVDDMSPVVKFGARGGVCIEQSSKRVLVDEGKDERCYPASTTKILTALIALERLPLDRIVTVPKVAEGVEGSSIYLVEGDKISVEDLLFGLMLRSGNDAAVTLAVECCGSVCEFAKVMNEKAREIGAKNSHFVNPHGLHDDNHYTTAYDLALICAKAYENEDFVRIASAKQRKITVSDEARYIANKNKLLKLFDGANGVKTGFTKNSGRCLVGGAKRGDMQVVSVVLNHQDMWNDTIRMLNFAFDNYQMIALEHALLTNGKDVVRVEVKQTVTPNWQDIKYPVKRDGSEKLEVKIVG